MASARFLLAPTVQEHTWVVTQLSFVFMRVAGLGFALYVLFGLVARPLASFLYRRQAMETFFTAKTEIPDVLDDDGKVSPGPSAVDIFGKPISLSYGSACCLCCITQCFVCCKPCCRSSPGTKRLLRLYDRADQKVTENFALKSIARQMQLTKMRMNQTSDDITMGSARNALAG